MGDYTGKFRLTSKEIELLSSQIEKSNNSMINLLSDEFVIADNYVTEELSASDLAKVVADLCKISLPSHDVF